MSATIAEASVEIAQAVPAITTFTVNVKVKKRKKHTARGRYKCHFQPERPEIDGPQVLCYQLCDDSIAKGFRIADVFVCDPHEQLGEPQYDEECTRVWMHDQNTVQCLMSVVLKVCGPEPTIPGSTLETILGDPEVLNRPF